jgi:hypothetical protein
MSQTKYEQAVEHLSKAIDIAIDVIKEIPPKDWKDEDILHFSNVYLEYKNEAQNPEPKFANLTSLKYSINDILTYFQECSGKAVDEFWIRIKEQGLPYKRENKLAKILKRKKIKNDIEFDFVIDVLVPYQQEKLIDENEVILLNQLIAEFEMRGKK